MKETGIVRRIDDLGRIVIPKEIRRTMKIRDGDPMEIFVGSGEIIFKKYSSIGEFKDEAQGFAETLCKDISLPVAICDNEGVVSSAGLSKYNLKDTEPSRALSILLANRETFVNDGNRSVTPITGLDKNAEIITPIINAGDVLGSIIVFEGKRKTPISDIDIRLTKLTAEFIAAQSTC